VKKRAGEGGESSNALGEITSRENFSRRGMMSTLEIRGAWGVRFINGGLDTRWQGRRSEIDRKSSNGVQFTGPTQKKTRNFNREEGVSDQTYLGGQTCLASSRKVWRKDLEQQEEEYLLKKTMLKESCRFIENW